LDVRPLTTYKMLHLLLLCCLTALASAQVNYVCNPVTACANSNFTRENELGCQYWCYMDAQDPNYVGRLECLNFHLAFMRWKGNALECDRQCYVSAHETILPRTCTSELTSAFNELSIRDSPTSQTVSGTDIELWCLHIKQVSGVSGAIFQNNFQSWWTQNYRDKEDPDCDKRI